MNQEQLRVLAVCLILLVPAAVLIGFTVWSRSTVKPTNYAGRFVRALKTNDGWISADLWLSWDDEGRVRNTNVLGDLDFGLDAPALRLNLPLPIGSVHIFQLVEPKNLGERK